ncbi:hypothetical protein ABL78_6133 [Leptomonas seymouri]|uniref:Uncharacterized protein n=1 Tax=Leptomonas seymouri TaxID=5684 RepID=A0A0N1I188_LEPSE|nr:hypothetical protein ABL78_6133 [Leptomonas seymouri]|eukprot:KPI84805.1 hypothetical protein ABL78_6133 [Leptomonas seymouri]
MTLDALNRASHLSSDTRIQDILCDLAQLLSFLDSHAAVTGGAAQTASGDCTATLPQRVTQLRMLANLVGALLCLLRRSVADAVPYVEAVLVTFAQIPPSSLLLRERQEERVPGNGRRPAVPDPSFRVAVGEAPVVMNVPDQKHAGVGERLLHDAADLLAATTAAEVGSEGLLGSGNVGADGVGTCEDARTATDTTASANVDRSVEGLAESKLIPRGGWPCFALEGGLSMSSCSDESTAFLATADIADLCRRDVAFTRYVLNCVVAIGIAMEGVHPVVARGAYMLANARAAEVLSEPNLLLTACLAASPAAPCLCEMLFNEAGRGDKTRDITFFPLHFFEGLRPVQLRLREACGEAGFWRQLPPNHVVPLFKC